MDNNKKRSSGAKQRLSEYYRRFSLSTLLLVLFTLTAAISIVIMGISFYGRFARQLSATVQTENQSLVEQVDNTFVNYLRGLMKVSDSLAYGIIKENDFETGNVSDALSLLYETNKDSIQSIALYNQSGELIDVAPASIEKKYADVQHQPWFQTALNRPENAHFSMPHVQNLFQNNEHIYSWVFSLSQEVDLTYGKQIEQGILLIDAKYASLEDVFSNVVLANGGYTFVMNAEGELVYHPYKQLVETQTIDELNSQLAGKADGTYSEELNGENYSVIIKTVGYTGWKIVGVMPVKGLMLSNVKSTLFLLSLFLLFLTILILVNSYLSARVSRPLLLLEKSVKEIASGNLDADIPSEGFFEVWHLENGIQKMAVRIKQLMQAAVEQEKYKRKNELDVLQSQINPHFLYNTLDIIVWMIENEKENDAVQVVTALSRFFRISLSKGKSIIPVKDEIEHVRNYLTIQGMRFKNKFTYSFSVSEKCENLYTTKLILQPIVENAIYHGMEFMDGDGEIKISADVIDDDLVFTVSDNGLGMPPQTVEMLLTGEVKSSRQGSGIGVRNVHQRIQLTYGDKYGISIESEPDCGTDITIRLPARSYNEEVQQIDGKKI